jgi:hypothetical protein
MVSVGERRMPPDYGGEELLEMAVLGSSPRHGQGKLRRKQLLRGVGLSL